MDGSKKIAIHFLNVYLAIILVACTTQKPAQIAFYVNDYIALFDTAGTSVDSFAPLHTDTLIFEDEKTEHEKAFEKVVDTENETEALINAENEKNMLLQQPVLEMQSQTSSAPGTEYVTREIIQPVPMGNFETGNNKEALYNDKHNKNMLFQQPDPDLQRQTSSAPVKVNATGGIIVPIPVGKDDTADETEAMLNTNNNENSLLQQPVPDLQSQPDSAYGTVIATGEIIQSIPVGTDDNADETEALLNAKNDKIKLLQQQVLDLQSQTSSAPDTVYVQESQIISNYDSIKIVAYYKIGEVKPITEDSIFIHLNKINANRNIEKVIISGYTDISGNEAINKAITNKRLNYFVQKTEQIFPIEKIFLRNFADRFASDKVVESERKLVLTLIVQK